MGNAAPSFDWSAWRVCTESRSASGKRSASSKPMVVVRRVRTTSDNGPPWTVRCNRDLFANEDSTSPQYAILRNGSIPRNIELVSLVDEAENPLLQYIEAETCYSAIPVHNSITCTDSRLSLLNAVLRLTSHKSFVYDKSSRRFYSILTNTDYLEMMQLAFDIEVFDSFVLEPVSWWVQKHGSRHHTKLISVTYDQSLKSAIEIMIKCKIHHLAVTDPVSGDILDSLNLNRVVILLKRQLYGAIFSLSWMQQTLFTSGIIEWDGTTITSKTTFKNALQLILAHKMDCLPIVDDNGVLVDVLRRKDLVRAIVDFASRASSELFDNLCHQTVGETIEGDASRTTVAAIRKLTPSDTVAEALRCFGSTVYRHKRVYIVNNNGKLLGSVSLLAYVEFLLQADRRTPTRTASAGSR